VLYPIGEVDFSGENRQEEEEEKYGSEESVKEQRSHQSLASEHKLMAIKVAVPCPSLSPPPIVEPSFSSTSRCECELSSKHSSTVPIFEFLTIATDFE
jgi:hypothetical protein